MPNNKPTFIFISTADWENEIWTNNARWQIASFHFFNEFTKEIGLTVDENFIDNIADININEGLKQEEEKILDLNEPLPLIQDKNVIKQTEFSSIDKKEPPKVISDNKQERIIKKAKKNKLNKNGIREKLKSKNGLKEAFILKEILDKKY